jgi:hypothetical protein
MRGVAIGSEADFAASESLEGTQGRIIAGFPCAPDSLWSLPGVHIAGTIHTKAAVNLVTTMDARSTDQTVKARADCFGRAHRTD